MLEIGHHKNRRESEKITKTWQEKFSKVDLEIEKVLEMNGTSINKICQKLGIKDDDFDYGVKREDAVALARVTFTLGKDLLKYENFLVDDTSGRLVFIYFDRLYRLLNEKSTGSFKGPHRYNFAGGYGIENRLVDISNELRREGFNPRLKTVFLTEFTGSGHNLAEFIQNIISPNNIDVVSLGIAEHFAYVSTHNIKELIKGNRFVFGDFDSHFNTRRELSGLEKINEQTTAKARLSRSFKQDRVKIMQARRQLRGLAELLMPLANRK